MSATAGVELGPRAPRRLARPSFVGGSALAACALFGGAWAYLLVGQGARPEVLVSAESWDQALRFVRALAGFGEDGGLARTRSGVVLVPAYLQPSRWLDMARLAVETLAMSVLAVAFAAVGMLLTVVPGARTAATGELLATQRSPLSVGVFLLVRAIYVVTRSVPELIWAMLLIFVLAPGILPGALALGLHNLGIVGKLCAEAVEDLDRRPVRALRAAGASRAQVLVYGVLPQVLPRFLTYILYRWEVIIRTTIVVGFVSAGGLGREFRLAMSFFYYSDVALILLTYLLLVFAVDAISASLRRLAA